MFRSSLIIILYFCLNAITGVQKVTGKFPPDWFIESYQKTILNVFPGSLTICFSIITLTELIAAFFFLGAIVCVLVKRDSVLKFAKLGFNTSLLLFTILFFGSFLAADYQNGFMDLGYFVMTLYLSDKFTLQTDRM